LASAPGPSIAPDVWIAPGAVVIGDVTIGAGSSVWYGAVVRADQESIRIGEATNVQDGCVLHSDPGSPLVLGDRVSVGHRAVLHGCRIHSDVLIGMGAIVLNDAELSSGVLVAAGCIVPEGFVAPAGALLAGVPAKVKRILGENEIETMVKSNARQYTQLRTSRLHRAPASPVHLPPTKPTEET